MTTQADFNLKSIISELSLGGLESRDSSGMIESGGADFEEMVRIHSEHFSELATFAANQESGKSGDDTSGFEAQIDDEAYSEIATRSSFELQTLSLSNGRQVLTSRLNLSKDTLVRAFYSGLEGEPSVILPDTGQNKESVSPTQDSLASQLVQAVPNAGIAPQAVLAARSVSAPQGSALRVEGMLSRPVEMIPIDTVDSQKIDNTEALTKRALVEGLGVLPQQVNQGQGHAAPAPEALSPVPPLSLSTRITPLKIKAEGSLPGQNATDYVDMTAAGRDQVDDQTMLEARSRKMPAKPGVMEESSERVQQPATQAVLRSGENRKKRDAGTTGLEYETDQVGKSDRSRQLDSFFSNVEKRPLVNLQPVSGHAPGSSSSHSTVSATSATTDYLASTQAGEDFLATREPAATRSEVLPTTREVSYRFTDASSFVREVPEFVAEIMREVGDKGEKHIRIRLFPENLGQIDATISETNEGLRVQLIAESANIAKLLRDSNSVLRDMLTNGDEVQFQVDVANEQQAGNAFSGSNDRDQANSAIGADEDAENTITSNRVTVSSTRGLDTYV